MSSRDWPVKVDPVFGCWRWQGPLSDDGYAVIFRNGARISAKREVYERERGVTLPRDRVPDHLCRNRPCVAPHHLEPVTKNENEMRKSWRYRARIARCPAGHDLKLHGVITPQGGKVCRECNRAAK